MGASTLAKLLEWVAAFVAKIVALLKELKELASNALAGIGE